MPSCGAAADRGVQHRHGRGVPGALEVALVGDQDRAALAAPVDDLLQVLGRKHPAGRVGRGVDPQQGRRLGAERRQRVGGDTAGAGEGGTDLVRRVGELRPRDEVTRPDPELARQGRHQLLGADERQHAVEAEAGHPVASTQPVDGRLPGRDRADRERVARRVGGSTQRVLDDPRGRVDRRADREVDDPVRVRPGALGVLDQSVPGEVRESSRDAVEPAGQWSCSCGGSAAINGWSWSISPILAAPPGEPRSSKKWTLAS